MNVFIKTGVSFLVPIVFCAGVDANDFQKRKNGTNSTLSNSSSPSKRIKTGLESHPIIKEKVDALLPVCRELSAELNSFSKNLQATGDEGKRLVAVRALMFSRMLCACETVFKKNELSSAVAIIGLREVFRLLKELEEFLKVSSLKERDMATFSANIKIMAANVAEDASIAQSKK